MIPVAFYAPLKSPDHPTPSGDREIARGLLMSLRRAGFEPELASALRLLDLTGDASRQAGLASQADALVPDLVVRGTRAGWRLWLTYHNFYKAPDLLGPSVAARLGIPYVQIESTRARKRLSGPWARFAHAAEEAAGAAAAIFYFTTRDAEALAAYAPPGQTLVHLRPFLMRDDLPCLSTRDGPMLAAAMMRPGDKLASYRLIAETLALLDGDWQLDIAGDGTARPAVETLMQPFGAHIRFLGRLEAEGMAQAYRQARLLFWPGVNEAIGLTYLEAQAAGIPVLAQNRPGLRDVLAPGTRAPDPEAGTEHLATALRALLDNPPDAGMLRDHITRHHLLPAAADTLHRTLAALAS